MIAPRGKEGSGAAGGRHMGAADLRSISVLLYISKEHATKLFEYLPNLAIDLEAANAKQVVLVHLALLFAGFLRVGLTYC